MMVVHVQAQEEESTPLVAFNDKEVKNDDERIEMETRPRTRSIRWLFSFTLSITAVLTCSKLCTIDITSIFRFGRSVSIESPSGAKLIKNQNRLSQPKTPEQTETVSMTLDEQDNNDLITSLMMNIDISCNTCNEPQILKIVITVTRWHSSVWTAWQQTVPLSQVELLKDGPRRSSLDQSCLSINIHYHNLC